MSQRLTAMEIENQDFRRSLRGYDPGEVDLFLRSVAEEVQRLNREHGEMLEETGRLKRDLEGLRSREQMLQKTLVTAQRLSDEIKQQAGKEGELMLREARMRADRILEDANDQLTKLELEISRSTMERETAERQLKGVLEQHMALLEMRREASQPDNLRMLPNRAGGEAG